MKIILFTYQVYNGFCTSFIKVYDLDFLKVPAKALIINRACYAYRIFSYEDVLLNISNPLFPIIYDKWGTMFVMHPFSYAKIEKGWFCVIRFGVIPAIAKSVLYHILHESKYQSLPRKLHCSGLNGNYEIHFVSGAICVRH